MRPWRAAGATILLLCLSGEPPGAAPRGGCDLRGPLSDFWPKVIRDWQQRIPGNNFGATQTAIWVSLVYGDPPGEQADRRWDRFVRHWSAVQEWNWVRAEIWKRSYSHVAENHPERRIGFRQNLILMGTPGTNPLLARALRRGGIGVDADSVTIADRRYSGGDLLLVAILPSPFVAGKYVLCIAGQSEEALLDLERLPFGETDYVLFRGRRPLESGTFDKPFCDAWKPPEHPAIFTEHRGWVAEESGSLRFHFDPERIPRESVLDEAARERRIVEALDLSLRFPRKDRRIEIYLYSSADEKLRETGDGSQVHWEEGSGTIHEVWIEGAPPPDYALGILLILQHLGGRGSPLLRTAMAIAASPEFEGRPLEEFNARLAGSAQVSDPLEDSPPERDPPGESLIRMLRAASFLRFLMEEGKIAEVEQLYRNSAAGPLSMHFRNLMGEPLGRAAERWAAALSPAGEGRLAQGSIGSSPGTVDGLPVEALRLLELSRRLFLDRQDGLARARLEELLRLAPDLAEAHLLLARIAFRSGDGETAMREARSALALGGDAALLAWAHVTLGSAEALSGRPAAATVELQDLSLLAGPAPPRLLAELWLENLGLSPNRKAVEEQLRWEARANLQNFQWDAAEEKLKKVLASNPENAQAHFSLSEVYQKHHDYWVERATLGNELHPGTTPLDPGLFQHLADRASREMEEGMVLSLPELSSRRLQRYAGEPTDARALGSLDLFDASLRAAGDTPDERHHHFFLGRGYFFASDWERARQELRLSLGRDGADQRIVAWDLIYLGFIELVQGRRETSLAYFRASLDRHIGGRVTAAARKGLALADLPER
jgi:tetratricopeptide (TPR) repeat protein